MKDNNDNLSIEEARLKEENIKEIELWRPKLHLLLKKIKDSGSNQQLFSEWLSNKGKTGYSPTWISWTKNGNKDIDHTATVAGKLKILCKQGELYLEEWKNSNKDHHYLKTDNSSLDSSNEFEFIKQRNRSLVIDFIKSRLSIAVTQDEEIEIEAMGVANSTLIRQLNEFIHNDFSSIIKVKVLTLSSDGIGVKMRAILESQGRNNLATSVSNSIERAIILSDSINNRANGSKMNLRLFSFLPNYYIIRINNAMLISPYLAREGFTCPAIIVKRETPYDLFKDYQEYFNQVFKSDVLSLDISSKSQEIEGLSIQEFQKPIYPPVFTERSQNAVQKFLNSELQELANEENEIFLDCIGVELSSVRKVIDRMIRDKSLPKIQGRFLIIEEESTGETERFILESRPENTIPRGAKMNMEKLLKSIDDYGNGSSLQVKTYNVNPHSYIVRINGKMLVSPYLTQKGYQSHCLYFVEGQHQKPFEDYLKYFEGIFSSDKLSKKI